MGADKRNSMWIKVLIPVLIGLTVVVWLFNKEFSADTLSRISFSPGMVASIFFAWLFMAGRDFGLTWRFRALTEKELSWKQALRVDMLCEFTTCVTPSSVGGSAFGMIYLNKEGIEIGRATTLMMTTLFLDELFIVIACPIIVALIPYGELFDFSEANNTFSTSLSVVFWAVYAALFLWTIILFLGIMVKPRAVKSALVKLFTFRPLRRWHHKIEKVTDNMMKTSAKLKGKPLKWWLEAFGATALSWCSRFLVVNALFLGFTEGAGQLIVFGRQFIVWIVLMISPTPGGSGVSEWLFTRYYGEMIGMADGLGIALIIALFWRIISYYVYLVAGVFLLPGFFSRKRRYTKEPK